LYSEIDYKLRYELPSYHQEKNFERDQEITCECSKKVEIIGR